MKNSFNLFYLVLAIIFASCTSDDLSTLNSRGPGMYSLEDGDLFEDNDFDLENPCAYNLINPAPQPIEDYYADLTEPEDQFVASLLIELAKFFAGEQCLDPLVISKIQSEVAQRPFNSVFLDEFIQNHPSYATALDQMLTSKFGFDFATLQSQQISWDGSQYEVDLGIENYDFADFSLPPIFSIAYDVDYGNIDYIPGYMVHEGEPCSIAEILIGKYEMPGLIGSEEDTVPIPVDTFCLRNPLVIISLGQIDGLAKWLGDGSNEEGSLISGSQPGTCAEYGDEYTLKQFSLGGKRYDRSRYSEIAWEWAGTTDQSVYLGTRDLNHYFGQVHKSKINSIVIPQDGGGQINSVFGNNSDFITELRKYDVQSNITVKFSHYGVIYERDWFTVRHKKFRWGPDAWLGSNVTVGIAAQKESDYYTFLVIKDPNYCFGTELLFSNKFAAIVRVAPN